MMLRLDTGQPDFASELASLTAWHERVDPSVVTAVDEILAALRDRGDDALLEYTARFDGLTLDDPAALEVQQERLERACSAISPELRYNGAGWVEELPW